MKVALNIENDLITGSIYKSSEQYSENRFVIDLTQEQYQNIKCGKTHLSKLLENDFSENVVTEDEVTLLQKQSRIQELKRLLAETDYRAIKYAEGQYTEEEYKPYKELRQSYRDEINRLEEEINA